MSETNIKVTISPERNIVVKLDFGGYNDHGALPGLSDDDHPQYIKHSLATAVNDFLVASGVGVFIKKTLAEVKTILGLGSAAYTESSTYAPAAKGVTNGDSHDHSGGDGAQIAYSSLSGTPTIPDELADLSDDSTHRTVTDTEKSTWNGKTDLATVKTDTDIADALSKKHTSGSDAETTTTIGTLINGADAKATPVDADMVGLMDSAASNILKKLSWANIKATLKTYFDSLYPLRANNLSDVANAATAFGNIKQAATTSATGVVELATQAEVLAGTDTSRAVVPADVWALVAQSKNPLGLAQAIHMTYASSGSNGIQVADTVLASGSVTLANSRLSLVDGTAFVDFSAAGTLTPYLNHKLTLTDSAGKKAIGYIKAAGTGETYDSEALPNAGFADTTGVSALNNAVLAAVAGGQSGNALQVQFDAVPTASAKGTETATTITGAAYIFSGYFKKGDATDGAFYLGKSSGTFGYKVLGPYTDADWAQKTWHLTATQTALYLSMLAEYSGNHANKYSLYDTVSLKQVLTPSSTGVTITSTPGGSTYNWASIESGFNYNDASGYTYKVESGNIGMGIGNFTLCFHGAIPDVTPTSEVVLAQKHDGANGWKLSLLSTGYLRTTINSSTYDSTTTLASAGVVDGAYVKLCSVITRESASVAGSVQPYVNGNALGSPIAIAAGTPITVNNASNLYILGTSTTRTAGIAVSLSIFNRALSAAEVLSLYQNGISESDKWGNQTTPIGGCVLALESEGIQPSPGQWLDSSTNKLHALQPAEGSSLTRRKKDFEYRWTNTWTGTHEAQYIGGVNQNVLPSSNIRIDSITMVCTATGVNVILGDGSDTDRFVASVALATYLDCTIANRNHDGTNRKLVIDPDGNLTGSITTTIRGTILD